MAATRASTELPPPPIPAGFLEDLVEYGWCTQAELDHALTEAPPAKATPSPERLDHVFFDEAEVARVLKVMRSLRHTKTRRWKGSPFHPTAWQIVWIIAPVFGWRYSTDHPDPELAGTRVARTCYVEIPRKNGKSTLVSALLLILLCADGEAAPEVYTAASDREQARIILNGAKDMALASPALRKRIGEPNIQTKLIKYPRNSGIMRALSRVAEAAHGLNVSGAAIDELHVHKNRDLFDAIDTGTGARAQPLIFIVTTADQGDEHSIYAEQHGITVRISEGVYQDPSHYGVIWAAPDNADPFADETLARANPGAGVTVTWAYLRDSRDKALNEPSFLDTYLRLHLNVRKKSESRLLPMREWAHTSAIQMLDEEHLYSGQAFGGLDLSTSTDFTALTALVGPTDEFDQFQVVSRFWIPEERLDAIARQCRVPLEKWHKDGWLKVTEGNTVDYSAVRAEIKALGKQGINWSRIGYDPWNANETVTNLKQDGYAMVPVRHGYASLSAPTKRIERLVLEHLLRHGNQPVLTWMAGSLEVRRDENGNVKPVKPEIDRSAARIDGMSALVMSMFCWLKWGTKQQQRRKLRGRRVG